MIRHAGMPTSFAPDPWLRRYRPRAEASVQLVCCTHAGGSASSFAPWAELAPASIELLAVQYPGRQDRFLEPALESMAALADALTAALLREADRPIALFGHSLGAAIAYEVAHRLERAGADLRALFVSGRPSPNLDRGGSAHAGSDQELLAEMERLGGLSAELRAQRDLLAMLLPLVRSDYRLSERYQPGAPVKLSAALFALRGELDPEVSATEAQAWSDYTRSVFGLRSFPGAHFYHLQQAQPLLQFIARALGV